MEATPQYQSVSTTGMLQHVSPSVNKSDEGCHIFSNLHKEKGCLGMAARIRCLCMYSCKPPYSQTDTCLEELTQRCSGSTSSSKKAASRARPVDFVREAAKLCVEVLSSAVANSYVCPPQASLKQILRELCHEFCQRAQSSLGILSQLLKIHENDEENSRVLLEDVEIQNFVSAIDRSLISLIGEDTFASLGEPFKNTVRRFILSCIANSSARLPRGSDGCVVCELFKTEARRIHNNSVHGLRGFFNHDSRPDNVHPVPLSASLFATQGPSVPHYSRRANMPYLRRAMPNPEVAHGTSRLEDLASIAICKQANDDAERQKLECNNRWHMKPSGMMRRIEWLFSRASTTPFNVTCNDAVAALMAQCKAPSTGPRETKERDHHAFLRRIADNYSNLLTEECMRKHNFKKSSKSADLQRLCWTIHTKAKEELSVLDSLFANGEQQSAKDVVEAAKFVMAIDNAVAHVHHVDQTIQNSDPRYIALRDNVLIVFKLCRVTALGGTPCAVCQEIKASNAARSSDSVTKERPVQAPGNEKKRGYNGAGVANERMSEGIRLCFFLGCIQFVLGRYQYLFPHGVVLRQLG
eukprot:m.452195 g.452195  ORF g.452195 m.452195 type:complete len:581 (-) comp21536_c0_seq7:573-2315(-)